MGDLVRGPKQISNCFGLRYFRGLLVAEEVKVRRVVLDTEHDNQKWFVIEGSIDGCPAVTKRDTINLAAIASGDVDLNERIEKMRADVLEYHARWLYLQNMPADL
jgi:hypothetical protein